MAASKLCFLEKVQQQERNMDVERRVASNLPYPARTLLAGVSGRLRGDDADVVGVQTRVTLPGAFGRAKGTPERLGIGYEPIRRGLIHAPAAIVHDREAC